MDIFTEKIVSKKKDYVDYLIILVTMLIIFILSFIIILMAGPFYFGIGLALVVLLGYIGYRIITSRDIEFEYSLTNGDLEIAKIISKKRRKRIFHGSCKLFEVVDKVSSNKHNNAVNNVTSKINAASSMKASDVYFFVSNYNEKKVIVYFEPYL